MFTFIVLGYTGGVLSLVMQGQPIFESYHFWTGGLVIGLLGLNGAISFTKFGGGKAFFKDDPRLFRNGDLSDYVYPCLF